MILNSLSINKESNQSWKNFSLKADNTTLATNSIQALCFSAHAALSLYCKNPTRFLLSYSFNASKILKGETFRLASYPFLHLDFLHLCMNMSYLNEIGPKFEKKYGAIGFAKIMFITVVMNLVAEKIFGSSRTYSLGFSGVLCALRGALIATKPRNNQIENLLQEGIYTLALSTAYSVGLNILTGINISHIGHLSGYLTGLAFGKFCQPNKKTQLKLHEFKLLS